MVRPDRAGLHPSTGSRRCSRGPGYELTHTDGSTEEIHRVDCVRAT